VTLALHLVLSHRDELAGRTIGGKVCVMRENILLMHDHIT